MTEEAESRVIVCVDDTDDVTRETSTGKIASLIADEALALGGTLVYGITRHQLLLREDIPYTSHNSAMAFEVKIDASLADPIREKAIRVIEQNRAKTSDPGLCIAVVKEGDSKSDYAKKVEEFGKRAKQEFCSKESAYGLAREVPWLSLSEHGGDGAGVVGALAGVGLRLGGNDGRFRGKWDLSCLVEVEKSATVARYQKEMCEALGGYVSFVDSFCEPLAENLVLESAREVKPVLLDGTLAIVCDVFEGCAHPRSKEEFTDEVRYCELFELDNDLEECVSTCRACVNCINRRWLPNGMECMHSRRKEVY